MRRGMLSALQREDSYRPSSDNVLKGIALSLQASLIKIDDLVVVTCFMFCFYFNPRHCINRYFWSLPTGLLVCMIALFSNISTILSCHNFPSRLQYDLTR